MGSKKRLNARPGKKTGRVKALPLLVLFVCLQPLAFSPLSAQAAQKTTAQKTNAVYVCPMDADVKASEPGKCPKCGMRLEKEGGDNPPVAQPPVSEGEVSISQIPDVNIIDQNGRRLKFYTDLVKGKTVAINFIFTTCTTICPPLAATFRKVQQDLAEQAGREVSLISISVDPATDLPERLKTFSEKFKAGPGWTFVTGNKTEIDHLLNSLGAYVADKVNHTPMVLIGNDRAGYWTRAYGLAPAATIIKAIREAENKSVEAKKKKTPAEAAAAYFPNNVVVTQDKKEVRFFDDLLKGKVVMINFAFTTCAGVCPPMTANLAKVQTYLGDRVGKDINMITISVDPETDTPEEWKKYAEKFKVKPGWYFLTGKKENINAVLTKLGGYVEDKLKHSALVLIGNLETGEWMKIFAMAKPSEIADAVIKIAAPGNTQRGKE
jgi:cytochrome oxidase Cu insertion factor (SCO1/SenC/PrrC family)